MAQAQQGAGVSGKEREALAGWKQRGAVSLWRYADHPRHLQGWHFMADEEGARSSLALIDLLVEASDASCYRTLAVRPPTERMRRVPDSRMAPILFPAKWRLRWSPSPEEWRFMNEDGTLEFVLGATWMQKLRTSIEALLRREGDFCIGPPRRGARARESLWFWWWPGACE